jgi:hypothetical protein
MAQTRVNHHKATQEKTCGPKGTLQKHGIDKLVIRAAFLCQMLHVLHACAPG